MLAHALTACARVRPPGCQVFDVYAPAVFKRSAPDPVAYRIAMLADSAAFPGLTDLQAAAAASAGVSVRWATVEEGNIGFFNVQVASLMDCVAPPAPPPPLEAQL
jgi:hypothetical protein